MTDNGSVVNAAVSADPASAGKVEVVPMRGGKGVMIYLPGEGPRGRKTDEALKKILE